MMDEKLRAKLDQARIDQFRADIAWMLQHRQGRRIAVWIIRDLCGVDRRTHRPGAPGYERDAQEGRREAGLDLQDELEAVDRQKVMEAFSEFYQEQAYEHDRRP